MCPWVLTNVLGCPTCRAKFNEVTVRVGVNGPVLRTYNVRNRRAPSIPHPESDVDIFSGFIAPRVRSPLMLHVLFPSDTEQCAVCDRNIGDLSADLAICLCCQRSYHSRCLDADLDTVYPCCPHCQTHLVTSSGSEFAEENYTHADFLEDNDTISQIFQYVSHNRGANQQGRITMSNGSRTSSRLRELRRVREFNETVSRIGESLFDGLNSHPDDEVLESHIVREAERESRREARAQRRRNPASTLSTTQANSNNIDSSTRSSVPVAGHEVSMSQSRRPRLTNLLTNSVASPPPPVRPQMSPEEIEAWNLLDLAESTSTSNFDNSASSQITPLVTARQQSLFSPNQNSSSSNTRKRTVSSTSLDSTPTSNTSNSTSESSAGASGQERKFKRPNSSVSSTSHRYIPLNQQRDEVSPVKSLPSRLSAASSPLQATTNGPTTMQQLLSSIRSSVTTNSVSVPSSSRSASNTLNPLIASSPSSLYSSPIIQSVSTPELSLPSQVSPTGPKPESALSLPPSTLSSSSTSTPASTSALPAHDYHISPDDKQLIKRLVREVITQFYKAKKFDKQQCLTLEPQIIKRMYRRVHKEHARTRASGKSDRTSTPADQDLEKRRKMKHWKDLVQFYVEQKHRELSTVAATNGATTETKAATTPPPTLMSG